MRRGKPQQQIYRPGSGPLRKSNIGIEESESDTNIVINSRQNQSKHLLPNDDLKHKSEGCSPRDKITDLDSTTSRLGDISINKDTTKRQKKPEQMLYVPRPLAQAREISSSQDFNRNSFSQTNGDRVDHPDRLSNNKNKRYLERKREDEHMSQDEWREKSPSVYRPRQGSEPRGTWTGVGVRGQNAVGQIQLGIDNGSGSNWQRTRERDTRSVEPSGAPSRGYASEKIQSKPPSGRRHSTIGLDDKRHKHNIDNLPPRFKKKLLGETVSTPEENWDGSSLTFQGHHNQQNFKNPSFHQMGGSYTLPAGQNFHNQNLTNCGYFTVPNKPRGRGRLHQEFENPPGQMFRSITPDRMRSPCNSRPPTPPMSMNRMADSRPQTPVNIQSDYEEPRGYQNRFAKHVQEDKLSNLDQLNNLRKSELKDDDNRDGGYQTNRGFDYQRKERNYDNRRHNDYNRDGNSYNRDNRRIDDNYNAESRRQDSRRDREAPRDRETPGRDRKNRDTSNKNANSKWDRNTPSRDNTKEGHKDRRKDNRRDRNKRSRSRDFVRRGSDVSAIHNKQEDDWSAGNREEEKSNAAKGVIRPSLEAQLSPVSPEILEEKIPINLQAIKTTLDWSEEVEMNDKLEAEALSDALTRSSSVASLQEISTRSLPPTINNTPSSTKKSKRRTRRRSKDRSRARDGSNSRNRNNRTRQNSTTSIESRDSFKVPLDNYRSRNRRTSRDRREASYESFHGNSRNPSRECSWDRTRGTSGGIENWREEIVRSRQNSERERSVEDVKCIDANTKKAGIIVLPQQKTEVAYSPPVGGAERPKYPETRKSPGQQKSLFDPNNPGKPIIVKSTDSRVSVPGFSDNTEAAPPQIYTTDQFGNVRPSWYDEASEEFRACQFSDLLRDIKRADTELQYIINNGLLLVNWASVEKLRQFLKEALEYLLCRAIKFCQMANVEQHFWKILYHNIIEVTRNAINNDAENKQNYKAFLLYIIDEGTKYFESLLVLLEDTYDFKLNDFLGHNSTVLHKGLGLVTMALVSAQKLFLFLGDLGRYREQVNETSNYGKCRQWYIKSHEINPKNGKPYNQLALLAVLARRKLDAVYYYMRSLMSSNPVPSARENLISLFDENRKKST
ncbi:hypothetical protein NQ318_000287 [Aromia moschata]|uniref:Telomerase-binding protein EST1A n=1 Tax=Aromia moschata TaxID=1265417 RepID=A0AAV8YW91_9CUCU|nr:hypothetical protein NQ318_000287 [Aromia moschata]